MSNTPARSASEVLSKDLDNILGSTTTFWEQMKGQRLFITGGTGFFGAWLLETIRRANRHMGTGVSALVLTRNLDRFKREKPHLAADPAIRFHPGDVASFEFPEGRFPYIIHAGSTSAEATFNNEPPLAKFETIVEGTRHTLDFAVRCEARTVLYTSSGSVYGTQPPEITHLPEDYTGAPDPTDPDSALGQSKRAAEFLCVAYAKAYGFETKIARCFSFVGPYLQLGVHYAAGNFIRQAIRGETIEIRGDGRPRRSYLYASDLLIWLLTIMLKGESGRAYNVGAEEAVSILDLATLVARNSPARVDVCIAGRSCEARPAERYVPSTLRARLELGLEERVGLEESVARTINFFCNAPTRS